LKTYIVGACPKKNYRSIYVCSSFHQIQANSFLLSGVGTTSAMDNNNPGSYIQRSSADSLSSIQQQHRSNTTNTQMAPVGGGRKQTNSSSSSINDGGLENIHRQSRHIASRLIGPKSTSSSSAGHFYLQQNASSSSPHHLYSGGNPLLDRILLDTNSSSAVFPSNSFNETTTATTTTSHSRYDPLRRTIEEPLGSALPYIERARLSENTVDIHSSDVLVEDDVHLGYPLNEQEAATTPESSTLEAAEVSAPEVAPGSSSSLRRALDAARSGSAPPKMPYSFGRPNNITDNVFSSNMDSKRMSSDLHQLGLPTSVLHTTSIDQKRSSYNANTTSSYANNNTAAATYNDRDESTMRVTEKDLAPFLRDVLEPVSQYYNKTSTTVMQRPTAHPSRSLCILASGAFLTAVDENTGSLRLSVSDFRSICESFGVLDSFRSDFWQSRRVLFFSYFDLRCAQRAASGLLPALLRRVESISSGAAATSSASFKVKYCVPLQNSSPADDSTLMISNLPPHIDEQNIHSFMESFGGVRSVHYVAPTNMGSLEDESTSYMVEFYDIQVSP
jgi:hypothetical protein